ncbi:hypothetical protein KSP39_PZI021036 [Platanthera zijinensis]|uniref:Rab-GAP TBC domain-containing protein n=1 Tax=Platanthera zijinensis TaxID=2320716 RepID=A0AAP0AXC8_9ASPA
MPAAPTGVPLPGSFSPDRISGRWLRFSNLRGVRWRINLRIFPSSSSASIDEIRRVAANARRSYASLRRQLLIDPHAPKDGNRSPDLAMDNPLSQNPESTWGRFFRNAELEKAVDQDLSRLYPQDDHYFHTYACQAMLRRILLVWCIRHPECGYRQGMHELLAPLIYVLHVDLNYLSQVRGLHEKYFNDEFDRSDCEVVSNRTLKKVKSWDCGSKFTNFVDDLDPDTRDVLLLSDPYGAEGELGIVLSEKFMEHDAYCMFDGLMNGADGVVAMNQFFYTIPSIGSSTGVPPVIEASSAIYHLLSIVDASLHSHLVELGVEPQYFALRWLRVLFGREFSLIDLLVIWDEMFLSLNDSCAANDEYEYRIMCSPRGAFILAMAVSMLLHVRSSLLATENATSCLKRLLNYPKKVSVEKIIEKARSCQILALEANMLGSSQTGLMMNSSSAVSRTGSQSPKSPIRIMPDSYWEEKWRVLHREKVIQDGDLNNGGKGSGLFETLRTEPYPSPSKNINKKKEAHSIAKHSLFDDLSQNVESVSDEVRSISTCQGSPSLDENVRNCFSEFMGEECPSAENFSVLTINTGPNNEGNDPEIESEKSSLTSNSFIRENEDDNGNIDEECNKAYDPVSKKLESCANVESGQHLDAEMKVVTEAKVRKSASSRFQWLWRIGNGSFHERKMEKGIIAGTQQPSIIGNEDVGHEKYVSSSSDYSWHGDSAKVEDGDKRMWGTLKKLGQSVLENVQVIESVLQQEPGKDGDILGGDGQSAAMAALKDLRKISIILSEM